MIVAFEDMKMAISKVLERVDHQYLNDLPEFKVRATTVENFVQIIYTWLKELFPNTIKIVEIELCETEKNSVILKEAI